MNLEKVIFFKLYIVHPEFSNKNLGLIGQGIYELCQLGAALNTTISFNI